MTRPLRFCGWLTISTCLLSATGASAAAWTMPQGEGRVIVNGFFSNSDKAFDNGGHARDIPDYRKSEVYALAEYGITDDLTLIVTPSFRDVSVKGPSADSSGLGYTELGGRYRLKQGNRSVFSLQASARIPGKRREDNFAQVGNTDAEYDLRAQFGTSFGKTGKGFLIAEGGYRIRSDDPPNEFRADVTLGYRPLPKLLLLGSVYNVISDGAGRGIFGRHRYHNVYSSAVYDVSPHVAIQFGAMGTVAGRNALRERGLFAGLWFRFGNRLIGNPDR